MSVYYNIYFAIPKGVAPDLELMWRLAAKHGFEHTKYPCFTYPLSITVDDFQEGSPRMEFGRQIVESFSDLMQLDERSRLTVVHDWVPPPPGRSAFSTVFLPFPEGGYVAELCIDSRAVSGINTALAASGQQFHDLIHELFVGYQAQFVLGCCESHIDFDEFVAVVRGQMALESWRDEEGDRGYLFVGGTGRFDVIRQPRFRAYPDLTIYGGSLW